ncbi:Rieske (2Fe-2S) protein [Gemmatimonas sp.]|uniref:QcrA and Rieske domain-containing protein n=1 Tax=Gemmatimonas sp. TaxID=1962908 RepID=UPI00286DA6BA|nr:Rieske (2Fe-2S) protein [Gemmatimonas sp.]
MTSLTRRDVLGLAAALLPIVACGKPSQIVEPPEVDAIPDDAVVITNDSVLVRVERIPALRSIDGAAVLLAARVIIIRTGTTTFRALSAECPHSGCGVSIIDTPRLICPCHGSEFDFSGNRLAGPAPTGLRMLRADFNEANGVLQVTRSIAPQLRPNSSRA